MTTPAKPRAFFDPGGFARLDASPTDVQGRLRWLTLVFARVYLRGWKAKSMAATLPFTAIAGAAFLAIMVRLGSATNGSLNLDLIGPDVRAFVAEKSMPILFASNVLNAILQTTVWIAPVIAKDARSGALLLYFSRPLRRRDYLFARFLAAAGVLFVELGSSALILVVAQAIILGPAAGGQSVASGLLFWLGLAIGEVVVAAWVAGALAAVALGCSAIARTTNGAPLLFAGLFLGSMPVAAVLGSVMGGGPAWQALDLYQGGLSAVHGLMLGMLSPQRLADGLLVRASLGLVLWSGLIYGSWQVLIRLLRRPPVGKGRA